VLVHIFSCARFDSLLGLEVQAFVIRGAAILIYQIYSMLIKKFQLWLEACQLKSTTYNSDILTL
jgi:hypothetical protein